MASQKEQAFKDYVRDASELVGESQQQSVQLFDLLQDPGGSEVDFGSMVNGLRVQAEQLVERAENADSPGQLDGAHGRLIETLELRRDGLAGISTEVAEGAGGEGAGRGVGERVAAQMQFFLASDVLYSQRFLPSLLGSIEEEGLDGDVPVPDNLRDPDAIRFLPDIDWLQSQTVRERLSGVGASDEEVAPGLHGTGLGAVTVQPAGVALTEGTAAQVPAAPDLSFDIEIANQGEHPEENIVVGIEISGSGDPIAVEETLDAIEAGETKVVNVPLAQSPPTGEPVEIHVRIEPVPGEEMLDNNEGTFQAIFSS